MADGYDALADRYRDWAAAGSDGRDAWLARLVDGLPDGARVLDLGCGPGVPTARWLAERFQVTGVDVSARQIEAARAAVPSGSFLVDDMMTVDLPADSFDAAVALYSMIHVRLAELPALIARVRGWLRPGGRLLVTLGTTEGEGVESDWLGVPMFFSGQVPERNVELLRSAGLDVLSHAIEATSEPEGAVPSHWILTRRPA